MATSKRAQHADDEGGSDGDLIVLQDALVAKVDEKGTATRRYGRGERFNPVENVHDVDKLIELKVLGRRGQEGGLRRTTALAASQAAARYYQESEPVLDLSSQPFEQVVDADADVDADK